MAEAWWEVRPGQMCAMWYLNATHAWCEKRLVPVRAVQGDSSVTQRREAPALANIDVPRLFFGADVLITAVVVQLKGVPSVRGRADCREKGVPSVRKAKSLCDQFCGAVVTSRG